MLSDNSLTMRVRIVTLRLLCKGIERSSIVKRRVCGNCRKAVEEIHTVTVVSHSLCERVISALKVAPTIEVPFVGGSGEKNMTIKKNITAGHEEISAQMKQHTKCARHFCC